MPRYWASWWSGRYEDEGCTQPPFTFFVSGERDRADDRNQESCVLWLEAHDEAQVRALIAPYFPDYDERFITPVEADWRPNDRWPGIVCYQPKLSS